MIVGISMLVAAFLLVDTGSGKMATLCLVNCLTTSCTKGNNDKLANIGGNGYFIIAFYINEHGGDDIFDRQRQW